MFPIILILDFITFLKILIKSKCLIRNSSVAIRDCSYLGIPCIGYKGLDTQRILHPDLTVEDGDINKARKLLNSLENDKDFYTLCSGKTTELYRQFYHESNFKIWKY